MKDVYLNCFDLQADFEMLEFLNQITNSERFEITELPEDVIVHELVYSGSKNGHDEYEEVGTHNGYYWHYFHFKDKKTGIEYNVNKNTWYPFEGKWNLRIGRGIPREYTGIEMFV